MAVLHPLKVVISNLPSDLPKVVSVPNFPGNDDKGFHTIGFGSTIYIEQDDFKEVCQLSVVYVRKRRGKRKGGEIRKGSVAL